MKSLFQTSSLRLFVSALLLGVVVPAAPAAFAQGPATCGTSPHFDCRVPGKSKLIVKQNAGTKDKLIWKWIKGAETSVADFGLPVGTTGYALCIYAGSHSDLVAQTSVPADPVTWSATAKGFKYKDTTGSADGIQKIVLKSGVQDKAKILVKGKGISLPDPTLPSALPVRVQLINSETGVCWEDVYDGTDIIKNETKNGKSQFKAKAGVEDPNAVFPVMRQPDPLPGLTAAEAGVDAYVGLPATTSGPIAPLVIPVHPLLNNDGDSRIHNDHYNSAVYNRDGPRGINTAISSATLLQTGDIANVCAMMAFREDGYIVAACINAMTVPALGGATRLLMIDPITLAIYDDVIVAPRPLIQNSAGGAYFSIDNNGRYIIGPASNKIEIWQLEFNGGKPAFVRMASYDVAGLLPPGSMMQDTVVDYDGKLWFAAITGEVGYFDPATEAVDIYDTGEGLQNSFAVDDSGVYIVSFDAMYKFSADIAGNVVQDWRTPYDNTGPGLLQPGSGTTPTLFGSLDDLVGFADTALPQINMVVLDRTTGAQVCLTPLFRPNESGAENTFLAYEDEVVIVNNAGFPGTFGDQREIFPGIEKYEVRADRTGCDVVWVNDLSFGNSAQLSTTTGLIYGWGADPDVMTLDAYYFTATDWITGDEVFRIYAGNDVAFNPVTGQVHLHPDGYAFLGSLHGITRLADVP